MKMYRNLVFESYGEGEGKARECRRNFERYQGNLSRVDESITVIRLKRVVLSYHYGGGEGFS